MNKHLSDDQLARAFVGRSAPAELQHVQTCGKCSAELERFGQTIHAFRTEIHNRIEAVGVVYDCSTLAIPRPAASVGTSRWALAAAAIFALVVPFLTPPIQPQRLINQPLSETSADELMRSVNLHLSRTMPAPMEPIMALMPNNELMIETEVRNETR